MLGETITIQSQLMFLAMILPVVLYYFQSYLKPQIFYTLLSGSGVLIITLLAQQSPLYAVQWSVTMSLLYFCYRFIKKHEQEQQHLAVLGLIFSCCLFLLSYFSLFPISSPEYPLYDGVYKTDSSIYRSWIRVDKYSFTILFLLIFGVHKLKISLFKVAGILALINVSILLGPALLLNYVQFEFELPSILIGWSLHNLFLVCFSEEIFFRGLLLGVLWRCYPKYKWTWWLISAALFGLFHYKGGWEYVFLSTLAGLLYGMAYLKTNRLEASILVHFLTNFIHIVFFSYPFLA